MTTTKVICPDGCRSISVVSAGSFSPCRRVFVLLSDNELFQKVTSIFFWMFILRITIKSSLCNLIATAWLHHRQLRITPSMTVSAKSCALHQLQKADEPFYSKIGKKKSNKGKIQFLLQGSRYQEVWKKSIKFNYRNRPAKRFNAFHEDMIVKCMFLSVFLSVKLNDGVFSLREMTMWLK